MKQKIHELIVVEGKTDIDFLSSFLDADFYQVGGSAISKDDIDFLKKANEKRGIIILTDPDFPGLQIRGKIRKEIPSAKEAFVRKECSIKHHKVGVAESTKDEVIRALANVLTYNKNNESFTNVDLVELGLNGEKESKILRKKVCDKLNIGFSNAKQFLMKINSINLPKVDLEKIVKDLK